MDWSALTPLVANAAPTIGSLLGGLIPFPGGAILGQVAGKVLAEALGVPPTAEAINTAITTGDPAVITAKLTEAEARMSAEVEKFKAQLADVQDARATGLEYVRAGSNIQWVPASVSIIVAAGFFGTLWILLKAGVNFNDTVGQVLLILVGALVAYMNQVVNYWLGSSAGSASKDALLAAATPQGGQTVKKK
jgi:hypothetical protein